MMCGWSWTKMQTRVSQDEKGFNKESKKNNLKNTGKNMQRAREHKDQVTENNRMNQQGVRAVEVHKYSTGEWWD